jgi:hypothetical protein
VALGTQLYYGNTAEAIAVTPVSFVDATTGQPADPASITCVLTDPTGTAHTYTYSEGSGIGAIERQTEGNYTLTVDGLDISGLFSFVWIGSGNNVQQVIPGTFRVVPLSDVGSGLQYWYTGLEELKHRLKIEDSRNDYEAQLAIQTVTNWVNNYAGRHFYQLQETRTFVPESVWGCAIDDLVSTPAVAASTQVNLDYDGDGDYEVSWTQNVNYQLKLSGNGNTMDNYNINAAGVPRPYRQIQVLTGVAGVTDIPGGGWMPWLWPYTYLNRVQVIGTWGWNEVPPAVSQASMLLCVDLYKSKDAPWGVAGVSDLGLVKVQSSPWAIELLKDYVNMRRKAGV